ncbi:MAG: ABC transporter permease [Burkholderiaceae bacterium]|nr:ABC transporter permease [Burkholderiaceae bacterium]
MVSVRSVHDGRQAMARWFLGWWRVVHFGAVILVLLLSPSTYTPANRLAIAKHVYTATAPILLSFTVLTALASVVLIRIVVVTASSYGLSQYALGMVVRVLVLELIPLTAALFVALRCTIPSGVELFEMRRRGDLDALRRQGVDPMCTEALPRVVAGAFSVVTLASVSCVVSLVLAYLVVHGFTPWGLAGYTRTVGQVFSPVVTTIFSLKTIFYSLAVSMIPMTSGLYDLPPTRSRTSTELQGLVRLFVVILLVEVASLVGNYY